jgi:hypothetical protein
MIDLTNKQKTNFGLAVTFAVLLGACSSKAIKMESSELALNVPDQEQVVVGEATQDSFQASDDTYSEAPAYQASSATTTSTGKSVHKKGKRKGLKSKQVAKRHKKSNKSFVAKADNSKKLDLNKKEVSAAATIAQEIQAPQTFDQETSKYPSNDTLNNIVVPAPMQEAAMMDEGASPSSKTFWMYVLAGFLIVLGAGGYVYKTRFSKNGKRRKLVYNG